MYIDNDKDLQKLCESLKKAKIIFFDTEFMREKTYYPKLCLMQLGFKFEGEHEFVIVDPLAKIKLDPLLKILTSATKTIVMHSGSQDMEILYHLTGKLPKKIFDTQIAAMVCGFGEQVSFAQLSAKLNDEKIDKSQRFTDWSKRPLSKKQIQYALNDVIYLQPIYEKLAEKLEESEREEWLKEEESELTKISTYKEDPKNAWQKIKSRGRNNVDLGILQKLAEWREERAIKLDIPRRFVIKDELLIEISSHPPSNKSQLQNLRGLGNVSRETLQKMWENIEEGKNLPPSKKPSLAPAKRSNASPYVIDMLKILLKKTADENHVAAKLIASSNDIEKFCSGEEAKFSQGWRKKLFGDKAKKLLSGKLKLSIKAKKLNLEES